MKEFLSANKVFIGAVLGTLILLVGGVYIFTKNGSTPTTGNKISSDILVPSGSHETSGIVNGEYLPATPSATVTLVEFGDYQCPACALYKQFVTKILGEFAGKINFVFRDFSFIGPESLKAAEAADCASDQNKFWQYHEYLYSHQNGENKGAFADDNLKSFAKGLGLDTQTFNQCLDSGKFKNEVDNSTNDGKNAGVNSTPSFFLNGVKIDNPGSYDELKKIITSF